MEKKIIIMICAVLLLTSCIKFINEPPQEKTENFPILNKTNETKSVPIYETANYTNDMKKYRDMIEEEKAKIEQQQQQKPNLSHIYQYPYYNETFPK